MNHFQALFAALPIGPALFILTILLTSTVIVLLVRWMYSNNNDGTTLKQIKRQRIEFSRINKKRRQQPGREM